MIESRHWINGVESALLGVEERAVHYGDGVFETLRVCASGVEFLDRHLQRLRAGCERLELGDPDCDRLQREISECTDNIGDAVLKVIVSRAPGERGYGFEAGQGITRIIGLYSLPRWPKSYADGGINVRVCTMRLGIQPRLAGIKHLNRLEQVLARAGWKQDAQEGLMLDLQGNLVEGTMSNVFIVRNDTLITPALDQCGVAGVMRSVVLDLAKEAGIETRVRPVLPEELEQSESLFICNSLFGIWPVTSIEGLRTFRISALVRRLQQALEAKNAQEKGNWYAS